MSNFPPIPPSIKHVAHFMKVAEEHDKRNIVISYWSRMYAVESAMRSISGQKPPEVTAFLVSIMEWLEEAKKIHADVEGITNSTVAQALIEEYVLQLFNYADIQDKAENFCKNVVKAFYTTGILIDTLQQFGTLSEEMYNKRKYAKWKAAHIHHCLKFGEEPSPGPPRNLLELSDEDEPLPTNNPLAYVDLIPPYNPADETPIDTPAAPNPIVQPSVSNVLPVPAPRSNSVSPSPSATLNAEDMEKAQKYCKWAGSALSYDDINTAIDNLQKALALLQTGKEN